MLQKLRPRKDEGFTLIELLIVIIVLGILVAIVLFSLGTFKSDSQQAACKADIKQLVTAETAYVAKSTATNPTENAAALVTDNYLQSAPTKTTDNKDLDVRTNYPASGPSAVQITLNATAATPTWQTPAAATAAC